MKYQGSCHCQKVKFEVEGDFKEGLSCNCSICRRKGSILAFVPKEQLNILSGQEGLTEYRFNTKTIGHKFCSICGVSPFSIGEKPGGPVMAAINLRCLEEFNLDNLKINHFDGKNH